MAKPMPVEGGVQIGGYELVRRIGRGGMAEVWVARKIGRARQQKYVAIKLMAEKLVGQERYSRMFRAECDLATMLTHANIVQVFDEGEESGRTFLVMEWVDGINLVKLGGILSLCDEELRDRVAAYVVGQLLHALAYAHSITTHDGSPLGVVHRDVSPQNILISNHGDVKLTDFGVAHYVLDESSGMHVKGKIRYMSPEQLSGQTRQPSLDLYAAGAILHELIDGKKFRSDAKDDKEMYSDVLNGVVPALSRQIAPELDAVRLKLLEADPARRFQNAEEAIEALRLWSGYGEMKLEVARLCATMTGVTRPRAGPGMSVAPMSARSARDSQDGGAAQRPGSGPSGGIAGKTERVSSPPVPTVALNPGEDVPVARGETVLLPDGGLPEGIATPSEASLRDATTHTSLAAGRHTELQPKPFRWALAILFAIGSIAFGGGAAYLVLETFASKDKVAENSGAVGDDGGSVSKNGGAHAAGAQEGTPAPPAPGASDVSAGDAAGEKSGAPSVTGAGDASAEGAPSDPPEPAAGDAPTAPVPGASDVSAEGVASDTPKPVADDPPVPGASDASAEGDGKKTAKKKGTRNTPKTRGQKTTAKKADVVVHVRLSKDLARADLRIGSRRITAARYFDGRLPIGNHKVRWRIQPTDPWRSASKFRFTEGREYVIRLSSNGPRLETK